MSRPERPILVTGANGHLGRGLIARALPSRGARAVVRSQRAAQQVAKVADVDIRIVDYTDRTALTLAARGCRAAIHVVGIIKETKDASYQAAHERTCEALVHAAADASLDRIVYLSIFGSHPDSENACLASKGRAEEILLAGPVPACVVRVPMVLGPGDFASFSLRKQATRNTLALVAAGRTLQQPIDSDDVIRAVLAALDREEPIRGALDLGGPECLSHRQLIERAASLYNRHPTVVPIPIGLARAGIALLERLSPNPPMTLAMFDVLQHDDRIDTTTARKQLDLELTPLEETLRRCVGPEAEPA
jgi:NADH dehydrogenase